VRSLSGSEGRGAAEGEKGEGEGAFPRKRKHREKGESTQSPRGNMKIPRRQNIFRSGICGEELCPQVGWTRVIARSLGHFQKRRRKMFQNVYDPLQKEGISTRWNLGTWRRSRSAESVCHGRKIHRAR